MAKNPYGTLGPSPGRVAKVNAARKKKKVAPKKSRNGTIRRSIRSLCSVSPSTKPNSSAPIDSAT